MIIQHAKTLNYTKPTDLFNHIIDTYLDTHIDIDTYKDEQYMEGYVLSIPRTEILKDYICRKKVMVTDVLPLCEKDYDKDALDFATQLGWEFTLYQDNNVCPLYDEQDWLASWNCYHYDNIDKVCAYICSKRKNGYTTAFIGYKMEDVFAMYEANYSGTCVDALEYTKLYCDFVSDRSFNSFAFAELLVHIVKQDVKKFLRENFQKYFIKK